MIDTHGRMATAPGLRSLDVIATVLDSLALRAIEQLEAERDQFKKFYEEACNNLDLHRAEIEQLREALDELIRAAVGMPVSSDNLCQGTLDQAIWEARAALKGERE